MPNKCHGIYIYNEYEMNNIIKLLKRLQKLQERYFCRVLNIIETPARDFAESESKLYRAAIEQY